MCQVAIDLELLRVMITTARMDVGRRRTVLLSRTTQMDGKTFPHGEFWWSRGSESAEADVKYARQPIVDVSYAIENRRKLYSLLICSAPGLRTLGYADSSDGASTSILDRCVFRVVPQFLHAVSPRDGVYIHLYIISSRNFGNLIMDLLWIFIFYQTLHSYISFLDILGILF